MRKRSEDVLQRMVMDWIRWACPIALAFHVPNGGKRSKIEAAILKGLGVTAGIPDLIILWPGAVAGLELKAAGQRPTPEQLAIGKRFKDLGHWWGWTDDYDEAVALLVSWGLPLRGGQHDSTRMA